MEILYLIGILILSYLVYRLYKFSLTSQWDQIQWAFGFQYLLMLGAVYGQIAGTIYDIPKEWIDKIHNKEIILKLSIY